MDADDKEATDRRAMEEATTEEAAVKMAAEEGVVKAAADEQVTGKTTDEAAGAIGDSSALGQAPSVARAKRVATLSGSTPPAKRPYMGVWKPRFVQLSLLSLSLSLFQWGSIL
jgi:hypothetical protein